MLFYSHYCHDISNLCSEIDATGNSYLTKNQDRM